MTFSGKGVFTAWDPLSALKLKGAIDYVLVCADGIDGPETQTPGRVWVTPDDVTQLARAGFRVYPWETRAREGERACDRLGTGGAYVAQAELPEELAAALALDPSRPRGLVHNSHFAAMPAGWECLVESYWNVNAQAEPGSVYQDCVHRGVAEDAIVLVPGIGHWAEAFRRLSLRAYVDAAGGVPFAGFCPYLAEHFDDADVQTMRSIEIVPVQTTTPPTPVATRAAMIDAAEKQVAAWRSAGASSATIAKTRIWKALLVLKSTN